VSPPSIPQAPGAEPLKSGPFALDPANPSVSSSASSIQHPASCVSADSTFSYVSILVLVLAGSPLPPSLAHSSIRAHRILLRHPLERSTNPPIIIISLQLSHSFPLPSSDLPSLSSLPLFVLPLVSKHQRQAHYANPYNRPIRGFSRQRNPPQNSLTYRYARAITIPYRPNRRGALSSRPSALNLRPFLRAILKPVSIRTLHLTTS
jgi:hypothetical protein